jgi:hypothetical protein
MGWECSTNGGSVQWDNFNANGFARTDMYLQWLNTKANEVSRLGNNKFEHDFLPNTQQNMKVQYHYKPLDTILSHSPLISTTDLTKLHLNIIYQSGSRSSKWSFSQEVFNKYTP